MEELFEYVVTKENRKKNTRVVRYSNGKLESQKYKCGEWFTHRNGDNPAIEHNGNRYYYRNDLPHRDNGPAVIEKHYLAWYHHGKLLRSEKI
jgi:hypothetical protein